MQSRLLRITSANAHALQMRASIEADLHPGVVQYTARDPVAVLTTADEQTALAFIARAGGVMPRVLLVVDELEHAAACERWL